MSNKKSRLKLLSIIGPGLLIAATGVGAGDLATASFAGSQLGTAILWAVVVGGFIKFVLNEGLARWQLVTDKTLLEGVADKFGPIAGWLFLPYLLLWSFFVGSALMSACGVALHAIIPLFDDPAHGKIVFGILSSLVGLALVSVGGFKLFEKVMSVCIAVMFVTVIVTAGILWPGARQVFQGLTIPLIPAIEGGLTWTVALIGGVGGTLTVLCYGYWIREEGRTGTDSIKLCRIDLGVGYAMTIIFGVAMVIIGSTVTIKGGGAGLLITLAECLEEPLGPTGRWLFLVGALGAVFSSLLGVWQAVPYLFADVWRLFFQKSTASKIDTSSRPYRFYLIVIATVPMLGLLMKFKELQKLYAVIGALFIPLLATVLLILNRRRWLGKLSNRWPTVAVLIASILFFGYMLWLKIVTTY